MAVGQYVITSGTAGPDEQATLDRLDEFMTGGLGWSRIGVISDTGTDNDRVWYSAGEVPGKYAPMYVRARGNSDDIKFYGYTLWSGSGNDEIHDATESQIPNDNSGGSDEYVFVGNKDVVFVSVRLNSDGSNYVGGFGYMDTFYSEEQDPYPLFVLGQNSTSDTFANTERLRAYQYDPDGFLHTGSTVSGVDVGFVAVDLGFLTGLATPNPRDGRHLMLKQAFYKARATTGGAINHEVRGQVPGLFQFYGTNFASNDRVVASGISTSDNILVSELGVGTFVVARSSSTNAYTIGPVSSYNPFPPSISDLELWLRGDVIERAGGDDDGGSVREWIDLSGKKRPATQNDVFSQPRPIASGTAILNQSLVQFDEAEYLTGSLEVVDTYTAFVVAKYNDGTDRQPLFYTRGAVGGDDTIISLEFNPTTSDSVEVRVRSDDSPLEEDIERISGLMADNFYVLSTVVSGSPNGTSLYVNGDAGASSTISDTAGPIDGSNVLSYAIGTSLDSAGSPAGEERFDGDIAEVLVYTRALSDTEHQSVVCYLGGRYGIAVSGTCC